MRNRIKHINRLIITLLIYGLAGLSCTKTPDQSTHPLGDSQKAAIESFFDKAEKLAGEDIHLARIVLEKGYSLLDTEKPTLGLARYYMINGRICYYEDNYLESLGQLDTAIMLLKNTNYKSELAKAYSHFCSTNALMGNSAVAIESAHNAIRIYQKLGDDPAMAGVYNFVGNIYIDQKDLDQALMFFEKAQMLTKSDSVSLNYGNILTSIGKVHAQNGNLKKAEQYYQKAYETRMICADIRHISSSLILLARLRIQQNRHAEALPYLKEAEIIYSELEEKTGLFFVHHSFAMVYMAQNMLNKAYHHANQSLGISIALNNDRHKVKAYRILYEISKKYGKYEEALELHELYQQHQRQLISLDKNRTITSIEHKNELQNKIKDNEILRQKNQIHKHQTVFLAIIISALSILIIVLIILIRMRNQNFKHKQVLLENERKMALANSELNEKEKIILANSLELKNKELTSKTLELLHQIETLQTLAKRMEQLEDSSSKKEVNEILRELKMKTRDNIWNEFHAAFNNVHKEFYDKLFEICPDLSSTEIRIAALLKLNLSTKEIASISNKSESAITTARHRLRQKLNLTGDNNLINVLMKI
ncbi:MAG: tetratricopeptide repeat protein [Bacteroidota bacterium]|nr:tetratricopeptide repeat protein [Bacteroidota bacterium]